MKRQEPRNGMHELSIAHSLVELAEEAARGADANRVHVVRVRVGWLSGVVSDALLFAWDVAAAGTLLEGATLSIDDVPVAIHCASCDRDAELEDARSLRCPVCGTPSRDVVRGKELELVSMEIDDAPANR
jgi:hydrogenase nickel incorporation protein HypA/HybF